MKKLILFFTVLSMSCGAFAADQLAKRLNIASSSVAAATKLVDDLNALKLLNSEYIAMGSSFQDSDFTNTDLKHLDAFTIGALLSTVTSALDATYQDAGNGGFNKNILLKVRK